MAYISRNSFAREEIHRVRVYTNVGGRAGNCRCDFCGNYRLTPKGRSYLYEYRIETDGGSKNAIRGLFCSVDCMRTYHGN